MSSVAKIKELREMTGAGMMDCRKALDETDGNIDKAVEWLRKKGIADSAKKAGRTAAEGIVTSYIHGDGRVGVLLEVNIETDFAAKNEEFREMVKDIAMQIAAMNPSWVRREEVPEDVIAKERDIAATQMRNEGKPEKIIGKIVDGRMEKFYSEHVLLDQPFIKDEDKTIEELVKEEIGKIGENIKVRRFARFELGEGIEREEEDLAAEVAKQLKK